MSDARNMQESGWYVDSIGTRGQTGEGGEAIIKHRLDPDTVTAIVYGVAPEHAEAMALRMIDSAQAAWLRSEVDRLFALYAEKSRECSKKADVMLEQRAEIDRLRAERDRALDTVAWYLRTRECRTCGGGGSIACPGESVPCERCEGSGRVECT